MTYDGYRYLFYGCIGASIGCFVLAVVLFFILDISGVIGNLTGSTAKKAIESIRNQNYQENANSVSVQSGKKGKKTKGSPTAVMNPTSVMGDDFGTTKLRTSDLTNEAKASATTLLESSGGTAVLDPVNNYGGYEGAVYNSGEEFGSTSILTSDDVPSSAVYDETAGEFSIEYEITYVHTSEVIGV